ncbi:uncharacterized protein LOC143216221 [Lasioglossum baleicum]|uniref:uncharacterized protein LOC143216221 n=1 Tax=Lasioglossum baleicum TaxID=434251 RepID=UPI003FCD9B33
MHRSVILLFFGLIASLNQIQASSSPPRVIIVGAGASGIAAATKLLENGIEDLLILEAEDRIGGRVKTIKFDEYLVDEGAQWIHGDEGNVAYDMAAPLNLTDHSDPYRFEMFTSNGEQIEPDLVANITNIFIEYLEADSNETMTECNGSYGECVADRVKQRLAQYPELNDTMQEQLLWTMNLMLTSLEPGDTWYDVSVGGYDEMSGGDRGVNWKTRGYSTILDIMMKKIPNPEEELPVMNKTILNAEVTKVDYSSEEGTVKVTTQDGKEYTADHVIMTPSLGVLKADYETLFTPQLSDSKIAAIKTHGYGNACKVHLAFNDTWFNPEGAKNKVMEPIWTEDELATFENDTKRMWMPYSMSFSVVEHKPRLLLLWISGKGARLIDDRTDAEVLEQVTEMLHNFFSKSYNVSEPVSMIRSKWHQNKHFRGTYSYVSVDSAKANVGADELAEPVTKNGKPVILFAGEATTMINSATVHGAIGSGWREAERLIKFYSSPPRVIIVGAGASGIAAATKLLENGIEDLLILEAEDRIGGRVNTIKFDEYLIDQGAQWVDGHQGNVAYDMAAPLNLTDHSDPYRYEMFTSNGEQIEPDLVANITNIFIEYLEDDSNETMTECNGSYGECVADRVKQRLAQYPELNDTMQEQLLWHMNLLLTGLEPGDTWYDVSVSGYDEMSGGDRGVNWKTRGYSTILDIMMKKIPNPEEELPVMNKTILNAEVTKVDYSSEEGTVKVTTQDGKEYTADHVIMTPSLGVLKADYETLFTPQLSDSKIAAIKTHGYGNACKVHLAFNDTWFNPEGAKNKLMGPIWTEDELEAFENDTKRMWMPYTLSFSVVEHKPRLLLLWISGKGARLIDDRTDAEVLEQVTEMLHNFFSKSYNVSEPVSMIRSKWHQNKHFRGTYSYVSVDSAKANVGADELAEPVTKNGKPVILFAGEATTKINAATVHGAIGSGWREAERLIKLYAKTNSTTE